MFERLVITVIVPINIFINYRKESDEMLISKSKRFLDLLIISITESESEQEVLFKCSELGDLDNILLFNIRESIIFRLERGVWRNKDFEFGKSGDAVRSDKDILVKLYLFFHDRY